MTTKQKTVSDLALSLGFKSIVPDNNDHNDLRGLALWTVVKALDAAYEAGRQSAGAPELLAFAVWFTENRDGPGTSMARAAIASANANTNHPADVPQLKSDAMTMALRLYGESDDSFAPETRAVMARWRPKVEAVLRGEALPSGVQTMSKNQTPSVRYTVKEVPGMTGYTMFQIFDGLNNVAVTRMQFSRGDLDMLANRMNLQDAH